MFKMKFLQGILASILSAVAGIIYSRIYHFANEVDFSKVLSITKIAGFSVLVCMLAVFLSYILSRSFKKHGEIIFNFLFSIISFICVMIPISITLPLNVQFPELFPGLAVPMVFFPVIAWFTINPLFTNKPEN
jgi:amino acid permease